MAPVCVKCQLEMRIHKTGAFAEEMMSAGIPYRIWSGDVFRCESCGAEVLTQFGSKAIAEHFEPKYATWKQETTIRWYPRLADIQKVKDTAKADREFAKAFTPNKHGEYA